MLLYVASSAHSKRLFSGERLTFETKRTSLKDAKFEKLLLSIVNKTNWYISSAKIDETAKYFKTKYFLNIQEQ